ncbi:quinone oxidoreductase [Penaeus vannamei]|uniref:Quinone oxidoreductase n=1 Tax=Penaeus vannamei TaxID=6689 RepID=A0A423TET8_PENVA|nr:quinone oxidoreductase [Penaeus vannamei]
MKLERVPVPTVGDKQVLIKVYSSGVNPVDTYVRSGQYKVLPDLPYIPGKDAAGVVHSVGASVTKFKRGDRVFSSQTNRMGTLAEYACVDEPNSLGKRGERVLIHGASGAVGIAATQIAKKLGLYVVGTAGSKEGIELVLRTGADEVVNHRDPKYIDKLSVGEKFDIILEMLSNVNLGHDLNLMKSGARTIVIGCRGPVNIHPHEIQETGSALVRGIRKAGETAIDMVYGFELAQEAHSAVVQTRGSKGKHVIEVQKEP